MVMIPKKPANETAAATAKAAGPKIPAINKAPAAASTNTVDTTARDVTPGPAAVAPPAAPPVEPVEQVATTTAVAAAPNRAVSTAVAGKARDVLSENFKDALRVDWNTLHRLQANQGQFLDLENNKAAIGDKLVLEIMSFQDNWQISPGTSDPTAAEYVRYSDDGKTTNQGEDCAEYLAALKEAGYTEAKMTQRVTIAGVIEQCTKTPAFEGKMIQIDLSQTSRGLFDRYRFQVALDIQKGRRNEDGINRVLMETNVQTRGNNSWTTVSFNYAPA